MLEHAGRVSVRWKFETKIAESSKTALKLLESFEFGTSRSGSYFSRTKSYSPFKPIGWTEDGVKCKNRVFLYIRYSLIWQPLIWGGHLNNVFFLCARILTGWEFPKMLLTFTDTRSQSHKYPKPPAWFFQSRVQSSALNSKRLFFFTVKINIQCCSFCLSPLCAKTAKKLLILIHHDIWIQVS